MVAGGGKAVPGKAILTVFGDASGQEAQDKRDQSDGHARSIAVCIVGVYDAAGRLSSGHQQHEKRKQERHEHGCEQEELEPAGDFGDPGGGVVRRRPQADSDCWVLD